MAFKMKDEISVFGEGNYGLGVDLPAELPAESRVELPAWTVVQFYVRLGEGRKYNNCEFMGGGQARSRYKSVRSSNFVRSIDLGTL